MTPETQRIVLIVAIVVGLNVIGRGLGHFVFWLMSRKGKP